MFYKYFIQQKMFLKFSLKSGYTEIHNKMSYFTNINYIFIYTFIQKVDLT